MNLSKKRLLALAIVATTLLLVQCAEDEGTLNPYVDTEPPQYVISSLTASPLMIEPNKQATIEAKLVDRDDGPVNGHELLFRTDIGTVTSRATTNEQGIAQVTYSAPCSTGYATVVAYAERVIPKTTFVQIGQGALTVSPQSILADGISTAIVFVSLVDPDGKPISGASVTFSTDKGSLDNASAQTDANGYASATLLSEASRNDVTANVRAAICYGDRSYTETAPLTMRGVSISFTADPVQIPADGKSISVITAWLRETASEAPITDVRFDFRTSLGVIEASGTTDENGFARTTLQSSTTPGVATVKGIYGLAVDSTQVTVGNLSLSITADPVQIPADGKSTSAITARLTEAASGLPIVDTQVDFRTSLGVVDASSVTDENGFARATLVSSTAPGVATVKALFGIVADSAQVTLGSLRLSVSAAQERMVADGVSSQYVVATLVTGSNNPVSGVVIDFSTNHGVITRSVTTDSRGMAAALLTSTSYPGSGKVIVSFKGVYKDTVEISFEDPLLDLKPLPMSVKVMGSLSVVTHVSFSDGTPVPDNTSVRFATTQGAIERTGITSSGLTEATLQANGIADDNVIVTAMCGNTTETTQVMFTPGVPGRIVCHALPDTVTVGGTAFSAVVAQVTDIYGNPVEDGTPVAFTMVGGSGWVSPSALTIGGLATARFTPGAGGIARVKASSAPASGETGIVVLAQSAGSVVASPDTAWIAVGDTQGRTQAVITARVYDSHMSPVVDTTHVTFAIAYGPGGGEYLDQPTFGYGPVEKQTSGGMASVTVNAGTKPGTLLMTIQAGDHIATVVKVGIAAGLPDSIFITTGNVVTGGDGVYIEAVSAFVRDKYNNPVEDGTVVYFTLDRSDIGFINPESFTGGGFPCPEFTGTPNKGITHACLKFPTSSMTKAVTIIARCGQLLESQFPTSIPIVLPVTLLVDAVPPSISGAAGGTVAVVVRLSDGYALPIEGACIGFALTGAGSISPAFGVTDQYGTAGTTVTIPAGTPAGKTTVKAKICMSDVEKEVEITIND
ncbi:MAG: invasin domain 3-containing protein [Candidatus Eisenbacteria bacterium]